MSWRRCKLLFSDSMVKGLFCEREAANVLSNFSVWLLHLRIEKASVSFISTIRGIKVKLLQSRSIAFMIT